MRIILNVLLMVALLTLSACSPKQADAPKNTEITTATEAKTQTESKTEGKTTPSKKSEPTNQSEANAKLIASSKDDKVKLYAVNKINGGVQGVKVDINGNQKEFDWKILNGVTKPQVFHTDLTGDGKEEAVIIINTGHGTELDTNEAHVLNRKNLTEIKVQSIEEIVSNIKTAVTQNGNKLLIKANAQGKEYKLSKHVSDLKLAYEPTEKFENKLYFGNMILNNVKDQKLTVNIGGFIRPTQSVLPSSVGTFHVTYKYDQALNEFIANQINFTPDE